MKRRSLLLSILFALVGGGATVVALTSAGGVATKPQTEQVVVSTRAIDVGAVLAAADFKLATLAKGATPADALHDLTAVKGRYAGVALAAGLPLRLAYLSDTPPGSRLAAAIPDGRIAVSVAVSDVISTGGFIAPGDRVNVLGVITKEPSDTAQVVLRDIQVLAVSNTLAGADQATDTTKARATTSSNPRGLNTTITLAVTLDEAQRLVQVDELGKLRLALLPRHEPITAAQPRS
jgi:pilus assembly protein CpaB